MRRKRCSRSCLPAVGALMLIVAALCRDGRRSREASAGKSVEAAKKGGTLQVNVSNTDFEYSDPGLAYDTLTLVDALHDADAARELPREDRGRPAASCIRRRRRRSRPSRRTARRTRSTSARASSSATARLSRPLRTSARWERNLSPKMGSPVGVNDAAPERDRRRRRTFLNGKTQKIAGVIGEGSDADVQADEAEPDVRVDLGMQWFGAVKPNMAYTTSRRERARIRRPARTTSRARDVGRSTSSRCATRTTRARRPANPDQIVWTSNTDQDQSLLQVKAGQADVDAGARRRPQYAALARAVRRQQEAVLRRRARRASSTSRSTRRGPPFDTPRRAQGGQLGARPARRWSVCSASTPAPSADQILVPGVPGYKPYNIYAFRGANVAEAKQVAGGPIWPARRP